MEKREKKSKNSKKKTCLVLQRSRHRCSAGFQEKDAFLYHFAAAAANHHYSAHTATANYHCSAQREATHELLPVVAGFYHCSSSIKREHEILVFHLPKDLQPYPNSKDGSSTSKPKFTSQRNIILSEKKKKKTTPTIKISSFFQNPIFKPQNSNESKTKVLLTIYSRIKFQIYQNTQEKVWKHDPNTSNKV